jgi:hypothetical protein
MYWQPPIWLVLVLAGMLAVPCSVVIPLVAIKLWERFVEPHMAQGGQRHS